MAPTIRPDLKALSDLTGQPLQRCSATAKRTGLQCASWAVPGATVCLNHGGAASQVQEAAFRRLVQVLVPQGVETLNAALDPSAPWPIRLRAAIDVLDRAGIKHQPVKRTELEVNLTASPALDRAIAEVLTLRLPEITSGLLDAEVIEPDAELVEEGEASPSLPS